MTPNPTINPAPNVVTCSNCYGWGTSLLQNGKLRAVICSECAGTGRRPIPDSETEQGDNDAVHQKSTKSNV